MKTYTRTVEETKPRLVIEYDDSESPRSWDNLGYFYTSERNYHSPDGNDSDIYQIMMRASEEAKDTEDHMRLMRKMISEETDEKVEDIFPVVRYEHGNVIYRRGIGSGFDTSNCGFYIVTDKSIKMNQKQSWKEKLRKNYSTPDGKVDCTTNKMELFIEILLYNWSEKPIGDMGAIIDQELSLYTQWVNGEVYRFTLYDENGEEVDSCGGIYSLDDLKKELGDEWNGENMHDYLQE